MIFKPKQYASYLLSITALIFTHHTIAGDWDITPAADISYNQSNNITLAADNEISDNVIELSPGIDISYQSKRSIVNVQYQLQSLRYNKNTDDNEDYHQLNSTFSTQLIEQMLWLNIINNVDQRSISDTTDQLQNNIFATANNADVNDRVIQPIFRARKHDLVYEVIANASQQRFSNDETNTQLNSDTNNYTLGIRSERASSRINWGIQHFNSETTLEDDTENKISNTEINLNYGISSQFSVIATVGQDDNDFATGNSDLLEGDYWSTGINWLPNRRLSLEASRGERFALSDASVTLNYQGRYLSLNVNSVRELITNGVDTRTIIDNNLGGNQTITAPLINAVTLTKTNSLALDYNRRKLRVTLSYTQEDRKIQSAANQNESNKNLNLGITWQIQSRTALTLDVSKQDDEVLIGGGTRLDKIAQNTLTLSRQLTTNADLELMARSQKRESENNALDYNERGYQLNFAYRF